MSNGPPELPDHPRGTLALIGLYGLVFVVGWLLFFVLLYLPRGAVTR
ncbi:MAG TPA: hypothetical protein VGA22_07405 [Gemmatimonadales bacterium]|jgi:hypothetical protein